MVGLAGSGPGQVSHLGVAGAGQARTDHFLEGDDVGIDRGEDAGNAFEPRAAVAEVHQLVEHVTLVPERRLEVHPHLGHQFEVAGHGPSDSFADRVGPGFRQQQRLRADT